MRDMHAFAATMAACGVGWAAQSAGVAVERRGDAEPRPEATACAQARDPEEEPNPAGDAGG